MDVVFGISDQVTVLHQGRVISEGPPEQVQDDERVVEVYLGGEG
jgi:ABC-type branched-subunit amino acid transport system ATPase component